MKSQPTFVLDPEVSIEGGSRPITSSMNEMHSLDSFRGSRSVPQRLRLGVAMVAILSVTLLSLDGSVPILALVDLGFHELGHLVTYWLPDMVTAAMGSIAQVAVPAGLAIYFYVRDEFASASFLIAWTGSSLRNVAVYMADAPFERLQLIGGDHDWAAIFHEFDKMEWAVPVAGLVGFFGLLIIVAAAGWCGYLLYRELRAS